MVSARAHILQPVLRYDEGDKSLLKSLSIVTPTYNRDKNLRELLESILLQSEPPKEVIVVDDSDVSKTRDLITEMHNRFVNRGILLKYHRGGVKDNRSISLARNIGATRATQEIVTFIDDDVVLTRDYVKMIMDVFQGHPNALGVQGMITNFGASTLGTKNVFLNSFRKVFFLNHVEEDRCNVLRSGNLSYPYPLNGTIECQWLHGANSSYRKEVFRNFKFDENLKEFSVGEDWDISYRIYKHRSHSLYITSRARVMHAPSETRARSNNDLIHFSTNYLAYLFFKNIEQTTLNRIVFVWSMLGQFITTSLFSYKKGPRSKIFGSLIHSYYHLVVNLKDVRKGEFSMKAEHEYVRLPTIRVDSN